MQEIHIQALPRRLSRGARQRRVQTREIQITNPRHHRNTFARKYIMREGSNLQETRSEFRKRSKFYEKAGVGFPSRSSKIVRGSTRDPTRGPSCTRVHRG